MQTLLSIQSQVNSRCLCLASKPEMLALELLLRPVTVVGKTGQIMDILRQLEQLLGQSSSSKSNLIKVQVFLRDFERGYRDFRDIWNDWVDHAALPVGIPRLQAVLVG